MMARPSLFPRPARPTTWVMRENVRSPERKSGTYSPLSAEMTRRHNDANVLAMGAGVTGGNLAERILEVFLVTEFEGGRHQRRVEKVMETERQGGPSN